MNIILKYVSHYDGNIEFCTYERYRYRVCCHMAHNSPGVFNPMTFIPCWAIPYTYTLHTSIYCILTDRRLDIHIVCEVTVVILTYRP